MQRLEPKRLTSARSESELFVTHLRLANWRNFKRVDLRLRRRAFFVGANASGKSNLLDVFKFLRDLVAVGGGFEAAVADRGGVSRLRCLAARQNPSVRIDVDVGTESEPALWRYLLELNGVKNAPPSVKREEVTHRGETVLARPDEADESDSARLRQTAIQQVTANREFRGLADFFSSVRYLHLVPQLIREPERRAPRLQDPFGSDFLERLAGNSEAQRRKRLKQIEQALQIAVPQLRQLDMDQDTRGMWHLRANYAHWRPQGAWQDERSFSDGTLRLIGLLWSILEPGGPLLLEEPELSLHPAVTRYLPAMFDRMQGGRRRQLLVATHAATLLSDEGISLDEVHLLRPAEEATVIETGADLQDVRALVEGGASPSEAVLDAVQPPKAQQPALL